MDLVTDTDTDITLLLLTEGEFFKIGYGVEDMEFYGGFLALFPLICWYCWYYGIIGIGIFLVVLQRHGGYGGEDYPLGMNNDPLWRCWEMKTQTAIAIAIDIIVFNIRDNPAVVHTMSVIKTIFYISPL